MINNGNDQILLAYMGQTMGQLVAAGRNKDPASTNAYQAWSPIDLRLGSDAERRDTQIPRAMQ